MQLAAVAGAGRDGWLQWGFLDDGVLWGRCGWLGRPDLLEALHEVDAWREASPGAQGVPNSWANQFAFSPVTRRCAHTTPLNTDKEKEDEHKHTQPYTESILSCCPSLPHLWVHVTCTIQPHPIPIPFPCGVGRLFPWSLPGKSAKFVSNSAANFFQMAETCRSAANLPVYANPSPLFITDSPEGGAVGETSGGPMTGQRRSQSSSRRCFSPRWAPSGPAIRAQSGIR